MAEPVMFAQAVESLFTHAFAGEVPRSCRERLRLVGIDLDRPLLPAYPVTVWLAALDIAAEELFPGLPRERAYHALGRRIVQGYTSTLLGRAALSLNRLLGPRRLLERMTQNLRLGNNFMEARLRELGPQEFELWINTRVRVPTYYEGFFAAALELVGTQHVQVKARETPGEGEGEGEGFTYRIAWGAPG